MKINLETCKTEPPMEPHRVYMGGKILIYWCNKCPSVFLVTSSREVHGFCTICNAELLPAEPLPEREPVAEHERIQLDTGVYVWGCKKCLVSRIEWDRRIDCTTCSCGMPLTRNGIPIKTDPYKAIIDKCRIAGEKDWTVIERELRGCFTAKEKK